MMSTPLAPAPEHPDRPKPSAIRGFTLMEILVVLAIVALLVGLSVTRLGALFDSAKINTAQVFVNESMKAPLFTYKMQMGDYPSTEEGLLALVAPPASKADKWQGPYLEESLPIQLSRHAQQGRLRPLVDGARWQGRHEGRHWKLVTGGFSRADDEEDE